MDYGLNGMRMDESREKELTEMDNQKDYGLIGMKMDRSRMKPLTKMGPRLKEQIGMKMDIGEGKELTMRMV